MITDAPKAKVDKILDTMWSGGISNLLTVIENRENAPSFPSTILPLLGGTQVAENPPKSFAQTS